MILRILLGIEVITIGSLIYETFLVLNCALSALGGFYLFKAFSDTYKQAKASA